MKQLAPLEDNLIIPPREPPNPHLRMCPQCGHERLVTEFECLPADKRCSQCIPLHELPVIRERKLEMAANAFSRIMARAQGEDKVPTIGTLLNSMIRKWGGLESLVSQYYGLIQQMAERSPVSAANHMAVIFKLMRDQSKMQQTEDLAVLSNEQLKMEMQVGMLETLNAMTRDDAQRTLLLRILEANGLMEQDAPDVLEHA